MATPKVIVDVVSSLTSPQSAALGMAGGPAPGAEVQFQGGDRCKIDPAHPLAAHHARMLDSLRRSGTPVYIETAPGTDQIAQLLIPLAATVASIAPAPIGDRHEVTLEGSAARHFVRTTNPNYASILRELQVSQADRTPVFVTDAVEEPEIIDVRPAPAISPFLDKALGGGAASLGSGAAVASGPVPDAQAQSIFEMVNAQSCPTHASVPHCIPFLYPIDGCFARAHQMARLMNERGITPRKIWINGSFDVPTHNNPKCHVFWDFHVAPFLLVDFGDGNPPVETVIDPSIFSAPVALTRWVEFIQGSGPTPRLERTDDKVYNHTTTGAPLFDPTHSKTDSALAFYQQQLANVVAHFPPGPPYACP